MRAALCFGPALRKRRSARPPCAPQARPAHTRQRATGTRTLPACLLCVVVLCHHLHCHTALQCSPLGDRAQGTPSETCRLRTPVHTACSTAATVLPFTALPPASSAAVPRVDKTKTPLGDILTDSGLRKHSVLLRVLVSFEYEATSFHTRHQNPYQYRLRVIWWATEPTTPRSDFS